MYFTYAGPLSYAELTLRRRLQRASELRADGERGASAIEWVMIAAITIAIVVVVGTLIYQKLQAKATSLNLDQGPT